MKRLFVFVMVLVLALALAGCQGGGVLPKVLTQEPSESLAEGTYTGVFIVSTSPLLDYGQKALDDPTSLPEPSEENKEQCEELDLDNEEVRAQVQEGLDKGKQVIGKDVPMTVIIKAGADGVLTSTVKVDFAAAFPEEECEAATDDPYVLTHEPGKLTMSATQDQEGESLVTLFEGSILKGGILEGTFKMTSNNKEYVEFTKTESLMEGTWKVTKAQ